MLCKRYKECTKRKWPHRYLGKLVKKIAAKEALRVKNGGVLSQLEEVALQKLQAEKEAIMQPVTIRLSDAADDEDDDEEDVELEKRGEEEEAETKEQSDLNEEGSAKKLKEEPKQGLVFGDEMELDAPAMDIHMASILLTLCGGS